jgi:hypothetical protein
MRKESENATLDSEKFTHARIPRIVPAMLHSPTPTTRFFVLSSPRSGTHMLRTSLESHPQVVCMTEMFNPDYTEHRYDFTPDTPAADILANHIFTPDAMTRPCVGFLLHREGARFGNWPDLWSILERDTALAVVSLRRRNLLRRYLSHQLISRPHAAETPPAPLRLDKDLLARDFRLQEAKIAEFDAAFRRHPLLPVVYEDLSDRYAETMDRIQSFLNVAPMPVRPSTTKRTTPPLAQAISNYLQLKRHFAGTKWHGFFED